MAVVLSDSYTRTTTIRIFTFFFFYAFEQSSADTARRQRDGVLILSCFSSDARFMFDFFASIGGSVEAELCSLIFLGRLISAVVAAAVA